VLPFESIQFLSLFLRLLILQVPILLLNFTDERFNLFCDPTIELPYLNGSAVALQRGNCTFSEKASLAERHGAGAVVVVSEQLVSLLLLLQILVRYAISQFSSMCNNNISYNNLLFCIHSTRVC